MSMINDALKRAKETRPKSAAAADGPSLQHVNAVRPARRTDLLLPLLIAVILLLAAALFGLWWEGGFGMVTVRAKSLPETAPLASAPELGQTIPAPAQPIAFKPAVTNVTEVTNTPVVAAAMNTTSTNVLVAAVEPPKPPPVTYKLQSIFYRPGSPSAVINGKTVYPGSRVGEAHVMTIGRDSATIMTGTGQPITLELP